MDRLCSNKGQIFSIDFIIAIFLFTAMVLTLFINRNLMLNKINRQEEIIERMRLDSIFDSLLLQPGEPQDWNLTDVEAIGLVNEPNELNGTKVLFFMKMDYNRIQELLGVEDRFYFEIKKNGSVVSYNGTTLEKGSKTWGESEGVVVAKRRAFFNGSLVKLKMVKW